MQLIAHEAKATLRKRARGVRASVPKSAIERRSNEIVSRLLALPVMAGARRVALFAAMTSKNEVNLHALDVALRARGAVVAYPSIDAQTRVMSFRDPGDPATMKPRGMMAPEPDPASPEIAELDLVVVPALLVDPRGYRLGYGGGFYDRTLLRYCPPARSIAVAFEFQIALDLPRTAHDVACDIVVSDAGIVKDVDGVSQL
ncbi:MAG: 5-formyltetrahydrofolate cyclo-ligase [Polyangiaceae bacterium]|nr:5-formyltetrahydrofolate cyclo-ligase [Polyangiaceae bacterium]